MYLSIANHLGLHFSLTNNLLPTPQPPATIYLPVPMVDFRETQAVGFDPHLSHLIYIYKSKITKYIYTWSSAP